MDELPPILKYVQSKLSLEARNIIARKEKEEADKCQLVEKLKLKFEADKLTELNRELELKIALDKIQANDLGAFQTDLEERLGGLNEMNIKDTKADLQLKYKRLEETKLSLKKASKIPTIDVAELEENYKRVVELQNATAEADKELAKYKGLSPDPIEAKRQVVKLKQQVEEQKAKRLRNLQDDVSKLCNSTMMM